MLACLSGPGDLSFQLLSFPQMNAGLQKWDTTQKMRSAQHPTPAELDAYAKKVANHPLTIKIFPNSVKVPQRKHIRRTVNGLDTSGQRYSPYPPSQAAVKTGLLAIVRSPAKGVVKDFDGTRARLLPEAMMNPPSAPYAAPSTLSHPQVLARQQALQHAQSMAQHPQGIPSAIQHPQPLAHPALQQQQPPHPANHLLQQQPPPPVGLHGGRKVPDADAPPNVTVSTSTIPLSMAATLQQNQPPDLSSIVHQINQFCQARAGISATSVCEGQIANPSPISRNLLISASTRVSAHNVPTPLPSCVVNPGEHAPHAATMPAAAAAMGAPLGSMSRGSSAYQSEMKQVAAWNQHQLTHLQQMCGDAVGPSGLMGKPPARELGGQGFPGKAPGYALELCMGQPFNVKPPLEKPTPSPPINGLPGPMPYANGHYFQPLWNNLLPTPNSDSSGSQDLAMPFHGGGQPMGAALECAAGPHYRAGAGAPSQSTMMQQTMEYLSGDFQHSCLREQGGVVLGKAPRPPMNRAPEPTDSRSLPLPGYR
ncbi:PREDICTED: protein FAM222B [Gekko japonicus]|uniref:Protein FAM222B n=1 Tax=Gekko japonicus TaxID=146911 RepID=A0ABM1KUH4_GEKJA|nr:PREDICTED: protein FAM222B [Gekko japonicus]